MDMDSLLFRPGIFMGRPSLPLHPPGTDATTSYREKFACV